MLDFVLLFLNLPKDEHEKIFDELDAADDLDISVHLLIAFLYLGMEDDRPLFEDCIERGVYWGAAAADGPPSGGKISNVDLSLDLEFDPDIDRLVERLENGEELTDAEIGAVAKAGRLEPEHLDDLDDSGPSLADLRIR
jgi:hypothetical protein